MPRTGGVARPPTLPSDDSVVVADSGASEWALVLAAHDENPGWSSHMALRFEDRLYRLLRVDAPPPGRKGRWTYRFERWPEGELIRRLVDYDANRA